MVSFGDHRRVRTAPTAPSNESLFSISPHSPFSVHRLAVPERTSLVHLHIHTQHGSSVYHPQPQYQHQTQTQHHSQNQPQHHSQNQPQHHSQNQPQHQQQQAYSQFPPAKRLRTRSSPASSLHQTHQNSPVQHNSTTLFKAKASSGSKQVPILVKKGPLARVQEIGLGKVDHAQLGCSPYGYSATDTFIPLPAITYGDYHTCSGKPQDLDLTTIVILPESEAGSGSPLVISPSSLDMFLGGVHPVQQARPGWKAFDDQSQPRSRFDLTLFDPRSDHDPADSGPRASPTLSNPSNTPRLLSYGDPPKDPYSIFEMIDGLLTPKTPDRVFFHAANADEEVLALGEAFVETPRTPQVASFGSDDTLGSGHDSGEIDREGRPGLTPDRRISVGSNGILLTPGDEEKKGLMGLGIVCRSESSEMGSGLRPGSGSVAKKTPDSVARRRVLSFRDRYLEKDAQSSNIREQEQADPYRGLLFREQKHMRYRTTSSTYALPFPNFHSRGRTYRRRMGKYPFNNPLARILFFSTTVILLLAVFGVGGLGFGHEMTGLGMGSGMRWEGMEVGGWMGGDDGQVFGLGAMEPVPTATGMIEGLYQVEAQLEDYLDDDYVEAAYDKQNGIYQLGDTNQQHGSARKMEKRSWRAKIREVGAMLCTTYTLEGAERM